MKVLLICFDWETPTGKTNLRILNSLIEQGVDCKVICAYNCEMIDPKVLVVCSKFPDRPSLLFEKIGNITGKDLTNIFWELRGKRKAKLITKRWVPDVVYARGNPPNVFTIGLYITKRINRPLFIHFGDPIPPTPDWNNNFFYRRKKLNTVTEPLKQAKGISFVTKEMMLYQQTLMNFDILTRSFVSPNPLVSVPIREIRYSKTNSSKFICLYLGTFFGNRSPALLIKAFKLFIENNPSVELHLVGSEKRDIQSYFGEDEITDSIKILPKIKDSHIALMHADLLIDVDSPYRPQVFTSSKLIEYLATDKPIICITPNGSATRNLLGDCTKSVFFCEHNVTEILKILEYAFSRRNDALDFKERRHIINCLNVTNITKSLLDLFTANVR